MTTTPTPTVLELSTAPDPGLTIRIDRRVYRLRRPETLSLPDVNKLNRIAPRIGRLLLEENPSDEAFTDISAGLAQICDLVLDAPPDVRARLGDQQRLKIMEQLLPHTEPAARQRVSRKKAS